LERGVAVAVDLRRLDASLTADSLMSYPLHATLRVRPTSRPHRQLMLSDHGRGVSMQAFLSGDAG
jgi:hypothetical protein